MARSDCEKCGGTGQIEELYSSALDLDDHSSDWRFVSCYHCARPSIGNAGNIGRPFDFNAMKKTLEYMMLPRAELERLRTSRMKLKIK